MSIIERSIRLEGPIGEKEVTALFDSGASVSCIRPEIAKSLENPIQMRKPWQISTADEKTFMKVNSRVSLDFYIDEYRFWTDFFIVPGLTEEVIIGASTLQQWRFKLDFEKEEVIIDPRVTRMRI
ncbi:MAG: retroviral-like aspartic protease [candidate division Zixibacteria bacterium]|nr:retroviral-like aspartic protease [Candidatus Tariuqbacter arcticus]